MTTKTTRPLARQQKAGFHGSDNSGTQYGIFTTPGARPERFSALQRPASLARTLSLQPSPYLEEVLELMTGQTAGGTTNAAGWCGTPPEPGQLKTCAQVLKFGKYLVQTSISALPNVGLLRSRADVPGQILNGAPADHPFIPETLFQVADTRSELAYNLFRVGVDLERTLEQVLITGVAGTDTNRTGWWQEFAGLDNLVRTGYVDAVSGIACPAADSAVLTWNDAMSAAVGGRTIVEAVTDLYYGLNDRARGVGMDGTTFAFVMRPDMFRALTDVWACTYATYRCAGTDSSPLNRDGMAVQQLRIEMQQGRYLLVDGVAVPVVLSDGIPRTTVSTNNYEADLFLVPLDWQGMPLLKVQYADMNSSYIAELAGFVSADEVITMNNGLYLVGYVKQGGLCIAHQFAAQMRLILETPFLAGRVDNIQFSYLAPTRDPYPGMALYQDGGVTQRS